MNEKALALFDAIKLKNINENLNVIVKKDCIYYESYSYAAYVFGDTGVSTPFAILSKYKDFLNCNWEEFIQLNFSDLVKSSINFLDQKYTDKITFNLRDLDIFNAIISAGKDNFICGCMKFDKGKFTIYAHGITYILRYSMMKTIPDCLVGHSLNMSCDLFYMFYRILKDNVTKKNPCDLNISFKDTGSNIVFNYGNTCIEIPNWQIDNLGDLNNLFIANYSSVISKFQLISTDKVTPRSLNDGSIKLPIQNDSLKHLTKAFDETVCLSKIKDKRTIFLKDDLTEMLVHGELNE